jgi:hypothetical protein
MGDQQQNTLLIGDQTNLRNPCTLASRGGKRRRDQASGRDDEDGIRALAVLSSACLNATQTVQAVPHAPEGVDDGQEPGPSDAAPSGGAAAPPPDPQPGTSGAADARYASDVSIRHSRSGSRGRPRHCRRAATPLSPCCMMDCGCAHACRLKAQERNKIALSKPLASKESTSASYLQYVRRVEVRVLFAGALPGAAQMPAPNA